MKTSQKLLTNSLIFAENRLCHETGAEKQETPQAQPEGKFAPGQKVEGFNLPKDKEVKVKEGKAGNDGKPELIEGVALLDNDQGQLVAVEREWRDAEGKVVFKKGEYLRRHNGNSYRENGEDVTEQFANYLKSSLIEKSIAIQDIETKKTEAKKHLEEHRKKALEALPKTATNEARAAVEAKYKQALDEIDEKEEEAKKKIDDVSAENKIEKTTADSLAAEFDVEIKKLTEEGSEEMDNEAEIKGKLKDPAQLEEWLKDPKNREYMRKNILEERDGKYIVNFRKLQTALNLSDREYKIAERNLRIGNLLEEDKIKKIASVKTKGKEMTAKYFYEGGKRVKGVYTEENRYIPIWNGTEISFGDKELEVKKTDDKDFATAIETARATTAETSTATAETAAGTVAAAGTQAAAVEGAQGAAVAAPEIPAAEGSAAAAKALGQVDQMPTLEPAKSDVSLWDPLKNLLKKGALKLSTTLYDNIDNWPRKSLGLAETATEEELKAAREKAKEQGRAEYGKYLEKQVDSQENQDSYKEFYEVVYGKDFLKFPQNPKVFAKYLELTGKTILTEGVVGKTKDLTWTTGDNYLKAFIDVTKQTPDTSALKDEAKDFVKKVYAISKESANSTAKIWTIKLGEWLSGKGEKIETPEKKANFDSLRAKANDPATPPEEKIALIKVLQETSDADLQNFGIGKAEFEKECGQNLAQVYFDAQDFESEGYFWDDLKDPAQRAFVEAFDDPSKIQSRAQLKGLLETPGVKPESFAEMALRIEKEQRKGNNLWAAFEIYSALQMKEAIGVIADRNKETFAAMFYSATLKEDQSERQKALVKVATNADFSQNPLDFQMLIFETLLKERISPDMFPSFKKLAEADLDKNAEKSTSNEYQKSDNNAILRARLMQARLEIAQGQAPDQRKDERLAKALGISLEEATKILPPEASQEQIKFDPKEVIAETKSYFDAAGDSPSEADYALLKELHALYNGENARKFDEELKGDTESQKTYASLMYKLYDHTKDKKYLEGIDPAMLTEFGSVEFGESQGDALYVQAIQEQDPGKKMELFESAKKEYLNAASKAKNVKEQKQLLGLARIAVEQGIGDMTELIKTYEAMDDQEAQETAVDLYLQTGNYQAVAELLKTKDKISLPFALKQVSALVEKDYASLAEDVCMEKGWFEQLINLVYRVGKGKNLGVAMSILLEGASYSTVFDLLADDDGRTKEKFTGTSERYRASEDQKRKFCKNQYDAIQKATDSERKRILEKLDIKDLDAFIKESAQTEAPTETAKEQVSQKDHTYTVEGNIVRIKTIDNKEYRITLDLPAGFKAKAIERRKDGDSFVEIYDVNEKGQVYVELDGVVKYAYMEEGDKGKYEMSYVNGIFKVSEKTLPVTEGNQEAENRADVVNGDVAVVEQSSDEQGTQSNQGTQAQPVPEQAKESQSLDQTKEVKEKVDTELKKLAAGT